MPLLQKVKLVSDACVRPPKGLSGWGHATCGILILDPNDDSLLAEKAFYLGEMTVPQAEYRGLIMALNEASQYSRPKRRGLAGFPVRRSTTYRLLPHHEGQHERALRRGEED